jgi:hypothetical protein
LRAGESGGGIPPEPIITRKKKESRASSERKLTTAQCPSLLERYRQLAYKLEKAALIDARYPKGTSQGHALAIFDNEVQVEARLSRERVHHAAMRAVGAVEY